MGYRDSNICSIVARMATRPRRTLSPEAAASVHLYTLAKKAAWTSADDRPRLVAELQEIATPFPHLLAENAGIFLGSARNEGIEAPISLAAAQVLIDAGADLAEVERWTEIGYQRTHPSRRPSY